MTEYDKYGPPPLDEEGVEKATIAFWHPENQGGGYDKLIRAALEAYRAHEVDKLLAAIKKPSEPDQQDLDYRALDKALLECIDAVREYLGPESRCTTQEFAIAIIGILDNQEFTPILKRNEERMRKESGK